MQTDSDGNRLGSVGEPNVSRPHADVQMTRSKRVIPPIDSSKSVRLLKLRSKNPREALKFSKMSQPVLFFREKEKKKGSLRSDAARKYICRGETQSRAEGGTHLVSGNET